ncbi:Agrin [Folsomia candida]|uniref:Agrin n=1 Tax=Folsomia candida TaxID=158441 RepID=A0A226D2Z0_FOLCA|nr:Agrin [Folsomia candida]
MIRRGFQLSGDFKLLKEMVPHTLKLIPDTIKDVIDLTALPAMILDRKVPSDLAIYPPRNVTNIDTSERGLAQFFLDPGRVHHVPEAHTVVVSGLDGNSFMADFQKRTCSCSRKGLCSHYIACLSSCGNANSTALQDGTKCGVYILYYALFLMQGLPIPPGEVDLNDFRKRIVGTIKGKCGLHFSNVAGRHCQECSKVVPQKDFVSCLKYV